MSDQPEKEIILGADGFPIQVTPHIQPHPSAAQQAIKLNNSPAGREFREKAEKSLTRRERTMEWRKANPDAYREYMAEYMKNYRRKRKSGKGYPVNPTIVKQ